jgi:hypothetical protein
MSAPYKNFPLPIEENPTIISGGQVVPTKEPTTELPGVIHAPQPVFNVEPLSVDLDAQPGTIRGISIGASRGLLRVGLPYSARAFEILADMGWTGKVVTRSDVMRALRPYMKGQARRAIDELSGNFREDYERKGTYRQHVSRDRNAFIEFVSKIADIKILSYRAAKMDTNSKPISNRGRKGEGRPAKALVYIPTEAEIRAMLKASRSISEDVSNSLNDKLQGEFSIWPAKPFEVLKSSVLYKSFIMSYQVFQHGEGLYSRKQLTKPIGANVRSAKAYANRIGIEVIPNDRVLEPLKPEEIGTLPKDEAERLLWIDRKWITDNDHIANSTIDRKRYDYTQEGARKALKASQTGKIYRAKFSMSTYNPNTSPYYGV